MGTGPDLAKRPLDGRGRRDTLRRMTDPLSDIRVVAMGVTSTGKSFVGEKLARAIGARFVEGDDLHPEANRAKMAAGQPLDDADRAPWLDRVAAALAEGRGARVVACSALKRAYRERLRAAAPGAVFVHFTGPRAVIEARMANREGHFMPVSLLDSQLATLEPPEDEPRVLTSDITCDADDQVASLVARLRLIAGG